MYIDINQLFPIILYILLIVLVIILIVLGIKLIKTLHKVDTVIDDVNTKMSKVDGVFNIIDKTTDYAANVSDKIVGTIANFIGNVFKKKKGNDTNEQE